MIQTPYKIRCGDILKDSLGTRRVLGVVDDIVFVSDFDYTQVAFFDTKEHIFANYKIQVPGTFQL